jgi:hypothetical protein
MINIFTLVIYAVLLGQTPQKVELYRFSDRITVKNNRTAEETVMFYNNKMMLLSEDDEVRQGTSALSECRFEDDGRIRFFSRARFRFGTLSQEEHVVKVDEFTRILILPKDNITLLLPGGTRLSAEHGECYIEREALFMHIRNAGFYDVQLSGHLVLPEDSVVPAGHSISIPLYDPDLESEAEPIVVREVAGLIVKTTGGYEFEEMPGFILVSRPRLDAGIACVGGARVYLEPGEKLKLRLP